MRRGDFFMVNRVGIDVKACGIDGGLGIDGCCYGQGAESFCG